MEFLRRRLGYAMPRLGHFGYATYFRFAAKDAVSELFPGIRVKMNFRDESCRVTWWMGERYEQPLPGLLRKLCADGVDAFYDIGANYGFFSYLILAHCPTVSVHAFEPNPNNFAVLVDTKSRNALARFHPQNLGLGDAAAELDLTVEMNSSGHSVFGKSHPDFQRADCEFRTYRIPVVRFDDWLAEHPGPAPGRAVAKMDIEGFELRALTGMADTLRRKFFKALVIEVYAETLRLSNTTPVEVGKFLAGFGYHPFDLFNQPASIVPDDARNLVFLPR